jgi:DNA-binding transcriptional ArsR family regulator
MKIIREVRVHPVPDASDVHDAQARLIAPSVAQRLAGVFKSLSDPTRLRIISMVAEREFCVTDLAAALEMEQSTISHQLRDMRRLGLVSFRREGRHIFYRLDDPHVCSLFEQGLAHIQEQ